MRMGEEKETSQGGNDHTAGSEGERLELVSSAMHPFYRGGLGWPDFQWPCIGSATSEQI
jgi:hypothetical protein